MRHITMTDLDLVRARLTALFSTPVVEVKTRRNRHEGWVCEILLDGYSEPLIRAAQHERLMGALRDTFQQATAHLDALTRAYPGRSVVLYDVDDGAWFVVEIRDGRKIIDHAGGDSPSEALAEIGHKAGNMRADPRVAL